MDGFDQLKRVDVCLSDLKGFVVIPALNAALGGLLFRIFNEGKATDNSLIGQPPIAIKLHSGGVYSESHGNERQEQGRRTDLKDLQFTGRLFNSIIVGEDNNGNPEIGFDDSFRREIAEYQEEQTSKTIFKLGDSEIESLESALQAGIKASIEKCLKQAS